jgi:hypothetical protein
VANTKISALTAATTPLSGTEVLPIVQSSVTVKVANNDLRPKQIQSNATSGVLQIAGPAAAATRVMTIPDANFTVARTDAAQSFTGDQTLSTGNLVIGTSGKGIDFSATSGTGTSELLSDYEEGTWTPVPTPVSGSITSYTSTGRYIKVGNQVTVALRLDITNAGTATAMLNVAGLPFTSLSAASVPAGAFKEVGVTGNDWTLYVTPSTTVLAGRAYNNSNLITSGYIFYGSCTYFTA